MPYSFPTPADYGTVDPTGVADSSPAFLAAFTANPRVLVIPPGTYKLTRLFTIPAKLELIGFGKPTLAFSGAINSNGLLTLSGENHLEGFVIDATGTTGNSYGIYINTDWNVVERVEVSHVNNAGITLYEAQNNTVDRCKVQFNGASGIQVLGVQTDKTSSASRTAFNSISRNELSGNHNFGIYQNGGAHHNEFFGNRCNGSGLELIGSTWTCYGNRFALNHAEGTGDNGMSISGDNNTVLANITKRNAHNGITLYGSRNSALGNISHDNNQTPNKWSGIAADPAFGGLGDQNTIVGNVLSNEAGTTQDAGVTIMAAYYPAWVLGTTYIPSACVKNASNIYRCITGGVSGGTGPTHTSGTIADGGGVVWAYVSGPAADYEAEGVLLIGNIYSKNTVAPVVNKSTHPFTEFE